MQPKGNRMDALTPTLNQYQPGRRRTEVLFQEQLDVHRKRTDHLFAFLMGIQWLAGIVAALWISPKAWEGQYSHTHIHVWVALFLGGAISGFPIFLTLTHPGSVLSRHVVAVGQMLSCGLLIHLTGGRIETHFQYFGALAFLAFYCDWRVLLTASLVAGADHFIRGLYWPQSVFGVLAPSWSRWLEHVVWVLFEDTFLVVAIRQNLQQMHVMAERQARLEGVNEEVESRVRERTSELEKEIVERTRAEEKLRVHASVLDAVANSIVITNQDGTIQWVNPAFTVLTGYSAQEAIGQNPRILKGGGHEEAFYKHLWQTISSGQVWTGQLTNRRKDGRLYPEEMTITPLRNAAGEIRQYVAIKQDITQRKADEQCLRDNEEKFRQLAENISDVFWMTSPDMQQVHYVSPAYERVWGRPAANLFAHPREWTEAIHPKDRERVFTVFGGLMAGEQSVSVEFRIARPNGDPRWVHSRGFQVRDASGKVTRLIGIVTDVTEIKHARQARERLVAILESTTDLVSTADPAGHLTYLNRAGRNLLGVHNGDITTAVIRDFLPNPDSHPILTEGIPTALRQGAWSGETVLLSRSGRQFPVSQVILAHKSADGKLEFLSTIMRDITERKRFENQLIQSQKMETVGKLTGGIAHEFNSILTAIIGQSELLVAELPPGGSPAKSASEIRQAAGRAAALTQQLLAYGRKQFLKPETIDLNRLIAGLEGVLRNIVGGDVALQVLAAASLQAVEADAGQVEQVIVNMVMNARDAMPKGGNLTLETANVAFDEESVGRYPELKAGNYVMLAISDTGTGMSEAVKARLFEPFFTTKAVGQGTGLGLSTCYGIIKQSGGHINAYSEPGRGTTFKIYLPQVEQTVKTPVQRPVSLALPSGTETVLLVEDDPALREMAGTLLRRLGYKVWVAANGVEALTLKQQPDVGHIDLLFTDVVMPHMSGKELADRVQALNPHTRILFTSAYTENATVHQGVLEKGTSLLQKPYTPSGLANKLRKVLDPPDT
jgi:two-component system cell cycle sensor histidine kinase/response regulator CckA